MFCKKCGNEVENGMQFCKNCGTPVVNAGTVRNTRNVTPSGLPLVFGIRIGVIIASILMVISTILPYVEFGNFMASVTGIKSMSLLLVDGKQIGDGVLYLLVAVVAILFVCFRKKIPVLACGVISVLLYWFEIYNLKAQCSEMLRKSRIDVWDFMHKGSGFHLLTFSVVLLFVLSVLYFILEKKKGAK